MGKLERIPTFMACSFADQDKEIVDYIYNFFSNYGFDTYKKVLPPEPDKSLAKEIVEDIKKRMVFIAVLTKRKGGFSKWTFSEVGFNFVIKEGHFSAVLAEKGLAVPEVYQMAKVYHFDKKISSDLQSTLFEIGKDLKKQVYEHLKLPGDYEDPEISVSETVKQVLIRPNGHGIIEYEHALKIETDNYEDIPCKLSLNDFVPKELDIPPFEFLCNLERDPFSDASFCYRVLKPEELSLKPLDNGWDSKERRRVIILKCSKKLSKGEEIRYAWGWAFPQLFALVGEDYTGYKADHDISNLTMIVRFELPRVGQGDIWDFDKYPALHIYRVSGTIKELRESESPKGSKRLRYIQFTWPKFPLMAAEECRIQWCLKRRSN